MTMYKIDFQALNDARDYCFATSSKAGWYRSNAIEVLDNVARGYAASMGVPQEDVESVRDTLINEVKQGIACTKFALIHSEISEALEGYRKDKNDDHLPDLKAVDVELADALIRIFDLAGYLGCDLATAVERKMQYNATRKDHSAEARAAVGGKKF